MHRLNIHAEIPDPVIHNYLTDLDLAVVLGHLMDNAILMKVDYEYLDFGYYTNQWPELKNYADLDWHKDQPNLFYKNEYPLFFQYLSDY